MGTDAGGSRGANAPVAPRQSVNGCTPKAKISEVVSNDRLRDALSTPGSVKGAKHDA